MAQLSTPRWSVRLRILAVILIVTGLGMALSGLAAYAVQRDRVVATIDTDLLALVEAARTIATTPSAPENTDTSVGDAPRATQPATVEAALNEVMSRLVPGRHESSVALIDTAPRFAPGTTVAFRLQDDPEFIARVWEEASVDGVTLGTAITTVGTVRYIAVIVTVEGDPATGVYVAAVDAQRAIDEVSASFLTLAGFSLASLVAVGSVGWFVAGRLLAPLRTLAETASRITGKDLSERIDVKGHDDVSALTETVNAMLDRVDEALSSQRQLLDDVRHELKTPITIVRGHLELLDVNRPSDVRDARHLALDELDRMALLVDGIEVLAQIERVTALPEPTDVADLTRLVFAKMQAVPNHRWLLGSIGEVVALASPARITQAWLELATNASKFSAAGSTITMGSTVHDRTVELWVEDEGPGIPPGAEQRIFERFGRADTGRGIAGSGLGLAIAAAIAQTHDGHIKVDSSPAGSRFGIFLPTSDLPPETVVAATGGSNQTDASTAGRETS